MGGLGLQLQNSPGPTGTQHKGRCPSHRTDPSEQFMFAYRREGRDSSGPPPELQDPKVPFPHKVSRDHKAYLAEALNQWVLRGT